MLVVDNTFASPYLQQPLALGADIVVYSTTKYLGGHSDVVGGALVAADAELGEQLAFHQNAIGSIAGPFDSWLVMRGIEDTRRPHGSALRERGPHRRVPAAPQGRVARAVPGTTNARRSRNRREADAQLRWHGVVSHGRRGAAAIDVCNRARLFTLAESLGGVESLIEHPGRMTHASVVGSPLEVPADLVRLSVGIENVDDLLADLEQALPASSGLRPSRGCARARSACNVRALLIAAAPGSLLK